MQKWILELFCFRINHTLSTFQVSERFPEFSPWQKMVVLMFVTGRNHNQIHIPFYLPMLKCIIQNYYVNWAVIQQYLDACYSIFTYNYGDSIQNFPY